MGKPKTGDSKMMKTAQKFVCSCGGDIKMFTYVENGKRHPRALCMKCGIEKRRPAHFMD